jgi:hypothetical protein
VLLSTIYVDSSAPGPAHDGASWTTAWIDLQQALSAAGNGDEIRVADGTYKPTLSTDRTVSFQLKTGVSVRGGYPGYGAADPNVREPASFVTVLSGDIGTPGSVSDNSYHVVLCSGTDSTAVLDGCTVTGGNGVGVNGGGVYNNQGSPTISNCVFVANRTTQKGGAIYNQRSLALTITNCVFDSNEADSGGAVYNADCYRPVLKNCVFRQNEGWSGAAVYNSYSSPTLIGCTFAGNLTQTFGGGIFSYGDMVNIVACSFLGNYAGGEWRCVAQR